ncbi:MAG: pseudouridine synthase [Planctomycetota bacterium]
MNESLRSLVRKVLEVQQKVRTCTDCGICCTAEFNCVCILPIEAIRIADYLRNLNPELRAGLEKRIAGVCERYRLGKSRKRKPYTCPFLEEDRTCALPFEKKPIACLCFNPLHPDRCEMNGKWFAVFYSSVERENKDLGLPCGHVPIPVAVTAALRGGYFPGKPAAWNAESLEGHAGRQGLAPLPAERLGKFFLPRLLSKWGVASRRQAEALVLAGRVAVNGLVRRDVVFPVDPERDRIAVDGRELNLATRSRGFEYIVVNKPGGVVTTTHDPEGRPTVMELVREVEASGLAPVGRLDMNSGGLLLMTNDHKLADHLSNPSSHLAMIYETKVSGHITEALMLQLGWATVKVDGLSSSPIQGHILSKGSRFTWLRLELRGGKSRQIRRQLAFYGHKVELLIRTAIGPLKLTDDLKPGCHRRLTETELTLLREEMECQSR